MKWEWSYQDPNAVRGLTDVLLAHWPTDRRLLVLCIGTDAVIGDAVGPLLGTWLQGNNVWAAGCLHTPINSDEVGTVAAEVKAYNAEGPLWALAVDANLSTVKEGTIWFEPTPCMPGSGIGHLLPMLGDASIYAAVTSPILFGSARYAAEQNRNRLGVVRLSLVYDVASVIFYAILGAVKERAGLNQAATAGTAQ